MAAISTCGCHRRLPPSAAPQRIPSTVRQAGLTVIVPPVLGLLFVHRCSVREHGGLLSVRLDRQEGACIIPAEHESGGPA